MSDDTKELVRSKLLDVFDKELEVFINTFTTSVLTNVAIVESTLRRHTFNPVSFVDFYKGQLLNGVGDAVPDIDITTINELINTCEYLSDTYGTNTSLIRSFASNVGDLAKEYVESFDNMPDEFNIAMDMVDMVDAYSEYTVYEDFARLDSMLTCMSTDELTKDEDGDILTTFVSQVDSRISTLETVIETMRIGDDNELDISMVYDNASVSTNDQEIMDSAYNAVGIVFGKFKSIHENALNKSLDNDTSITYIYSHFNESSVTSSSDHYDSIDSTFENSTTITEFFDALELPVDITNKVGMLDVAIEITDTAIYEEEVPTDRLPCFSRYTATVNLTIGNTTKSGTGEYVYGIPVRLLGCGVYGVTQLTSPTSEELIIYKSSLLIAIKNAIRNAIDNFELNEIDIQLY